MRKRRLGVFMALALTFALAAAPEAVNAEEVGDEAAGSITVQIGDETRSYDSFDDAAMIHNETQDKYYEQSKLQAAINEAGENDVIALQPGTYADNIDINETITLRGAGASNTDVILTGVVNIAANDVVLDNMWFQQTYTGSEGTSRLTTTGTNLTVTNSVIQRMTGTAKPFGDIITYNASAGTLKLVNTELIAPFSGTADAINAASPSVIGVGSWGTQGEEAWNLQMDGCTVRTNGFAVFDRWNNATYKNTTFTGLEEVEGLPEDVTVLTCYMALNSTHVNDVSYDRCTFKNMRSWGVFAAGNSVSITNSVFEGSNQSRAVSISWGTIDECTITGNEFDLAGSGYGIKFEDSVKEDSRINIADNTFMNSNNEEDGYAVSNVDGDGAEAENEIDVKGSVFVDSTVYYVGAVNLEDEGIPNTDKVVLVQDNIKYSLPTLAEALAMSGDGDVIWLLDDLTEETTVSKNITIMKNGFVMDTEKVTGAENYYMTENDEAYVFTYHHVIKVDAKDPTCTENGNIEYWYCDDCGKYFEDAGLTKEISQADTVLEKIAHKYENGVCKVCGAKDADYKPGDSNNGSDSDKKAPQTGDTAQVQLYLYAALISAAVLAGVSALKKSRMK